MSKARKALAEAQRLEANVGAGVREEVVFRGARKIGGEYALVAVTWQKWGCAEDEYCGDDKAGGSGGGGGGGGSSCGGGGGGEGGGGDGTHKMRLAICFSGERGAGGHKEHDLVKRVCALEGSEQARARAAELVAALRLCAESGAPLLPDDW